MIYCSNCGTQNRDGSKFCNSCGTTLTAGGDGHVQQPPSADATKAAANAPAPSASDSTPPVSTPSPSEDERVDLPEWLRRLRAAVEADQAAGPIEPAEAQVPSEPAPPPAKTSTEEWLSLLRENPPEVEDKPASPPAESDESPDWIRKLTELTPDSEEPDLAKMADEEIRAWKETPPAEPGSSAPTAPDEPEKQFFGEIDSNVIAEVQASQVEQEQRPVPVDDRDELPAWLREIGEQEQRQDEPTAQAAAQMPVPDEAAAAEPPRTEAVEQELPFDHQWVPGQAEEANAEIPAWVRRLRPQSLDEEPTTSEPPTPDLPSATSEQQPTSGESIARAEPEISGPIRPTDLPEDVEGEESGDEAILPDWLRLATETEKPQGAEPTASAARVIEPARPDEVPSWVAALKPSSISEPAAPLEGANVERNPVMEGLPGVLPLAVAIAEPHVSADRPAKAEAPKGGHLFESILAETPPVTETATPAKAQRKLSMRPLIYLALLLAVLVPFLLPYNMAGYAVAITDTSSNFYGVLRTVPANGTVVISFDYEPSAAGEMDMLANAIVRDLAARNVKIIAISTLPTGPQVAQRVFVNALASNTNYAYGTGYVNSGYIAGQEAGLLQLATDGFSAGRKDYVLGQPLDRFPLTASFKKLTDARLIVELAGSEEPLKLWMEQAQPRVPVQLIAGVSAGVEPRAQAYLNAKQLSGYTAGLMDAARLEVLENSTGLAVASVNGLTWAMAVLVAVIVIGNVVYWSSRLRGKAA